MLINLQDKFLSAFFAVCLGFAALLLLGRWLRGRKGTVGRVSFALCVCFICGVGQLFMNLSFVLCYALYVKNGSSPALSDMGVAFIGVSVGFFYLLWRLSALPRTAYSLLPHGLYSAFLLYRFFFAEGLWGRVTYLVINPLFGFIGGGKAGALGAVGALLPFACAALGRGLGVAGVDKCSKVCDNKQMRRR